MSDDRDRTPRPRVWMDADERAKRALAEAGRSQMRDIELDATLPEPDDRDERDVAARGAVAHESTDETTDVHKLMQLVDLDAIDVDPKIKRVAEKMLEVMWQHQRNADRRSANHTLDLAAKDLGEAAKLVRSFRNWLRAGVVALSLSLGTFGIWLYHWIGNRSVAAERARVAEQRLDTVVRRQDAMLVAMMRAGIFPHFVDGALSLPSATHTETLP